MTSTVGTEVRPYLLGGEPVAGGERMAVTFPYDGRAVAEVTLADDKAIERALAIATAARETTAAIPPHERASVLNQAAVLAEERLEELARQMTLETGNAIWETRIEVRRTAEILRNVEFGAPVSELVLCHHERWDGTGYPDNLSGSQIPLLARVVQVADIYDALISPRPYKRAFTAAEALDMLSEETEKGWRDPEVVKEFLRLHDSVITRVAEYTSSSDHSLEAMRTALLGLHQVSS